MVKNVDSSKLPLDGVLRMLMRIDLHNYIINKWLILYERVMLFCCVICNVYCSDIM